MSEKRKKYLGQLPRLQATLAENVKRLRLAQDDGKRNVGINFVAKELRFSNNALAAIERGKGNPTLETLVALSAYFGLSFWELFIKDVDPEQRPHIVTAREMLLHSQFQELKRAMVNAENPADTGQFSPAPPQRQLSAPKRSARRRVRNK